MHRASEESGTAGSLSIFETTCAYCAARFRVLATQGAEDLHEEEYACPECGKTYAIDAAGEPEVQLLRPRQDGKTDRYQETMF